MRDRARRLANQEFLRFHDQTFTYADIDRLSDAAARGLLARGVGKGDKVSIMLPNRPEFVHVWFGAAKIGAVEVPVNTSYKGEFLRHIVDQSDSKLLVVDGSFLERLLPLQDHLPKLLSVVVVGPAPAEAFAALKIPALSFDEFLAAPPAALDIQVHPSDPQSIIYTSG
ncbi:MAG: AMP-binding protein [Thermoleophilia bacterium]